MPAPAPTAENTRDPLAEQPGELRVTGDNRRQLETERAGLIQQARSLRDAADRDSRELHADEVEQFDRLVGRAEEIHAALARFQSRSRLDALIEETDRPPQRRTSPTSSGEPADPAARIEGERNRVFGTYVRHGERGIIGPDESRTYQGMRALGMTTGGTGGFLQAPEVFSQGLIKAVDDATYVWASATKIPVQFGQSVGCPSLESDPGDSEWTSEISLGTAEDSTMAVGKRRLTPHPLSKYIAVSNDLLQIPGFNVEGFVQSRLGYKNAITLEKALLSTASTGATPLSVFVATADGVPSSRDFTGDNTTTALRTDSLKEAVWGLKEGYLNDPSTAWMFSRTAMLQLHKLKDGEGRYLLTPDLAGRQGMQMLGFPVKVSEYAPATFTTGKYVGIIGAWSTVWGAYVSAVSFQRFVEIRGLQNQTIFASRTHIDAMPTMGEAFSRVKLA